MTFDSPWTAVVAVNGLIRGTLVQLTVPPLRWGLIVLLGHFQVHAGLVGQQTAAMLLYERDNDNDAGFPRRDGRLPSLPEPTLRDANRDPRLYKTVSPGCRDGLPLILSAAKTYLFARRKRVAGSRWSFCDVGQGRGSGTGTGLGQPRGNSPLTRGGGAESSKKHINSHIT